MESLVPRLWLYCEVEKTPWWGLAKKLGAGLLWKGGFPPSPPFSLLAFCEVSGSLHHIVATMIYCGTTGPKAAGPVLIINLIISGILSR